MTITRNEIRLRNGLNATTPANDNSVKIYAPQWVEKELTKLSQDLFKNGPITFRLIDDNGNWTEKKFTHPLSLSDLQLIARNESKNMSGVINLQQYPGLDPQTVFALKDLVKQCIIVGRDTVNSYGGYPPGRNPNVPIPETERREAIVCDLSGMQFQASYNTGRHCLVYEDSTKSPPGALDKEIFQSVVGSKQNDYRDCTPPRYVDINVKFRDNSEPSPCKFDTFAYQQFVKQDFILAARALKDQAKNGEAIDFRFIKYGAGFFAEGLQTGNNEAFIERQIVAGIASALDELRNSNPEVFESIKHITLPFYKTLTPEELKMLNDKAGVTVVAENIDALKPRAGYVTGLTNGGDPHVSLGNEMHHASVDAAIAENLAGKGAKFSPGINATMQSTYSAMRPASSEATMAYSASFEKIMAYAHKYQNAKDPVDTKKKEVCDNIIKILNSPQSYQRKAEQLRSLITTQQDQVEHKVLNQFRKSDPTIIAYAKEMLSIVEKLGGVENKPVEKRRATQTAPDAKPSTLSSLKTQITKKARSLSDQGSKLVNSSSVIMKSMGSRGKAIARGFSEPTPKPKETQQFVHLRPKGENVFDRLKLYIPDKHRDLYENHRQTIAKIDKLLYEISDLLVINKSVELKPTTPEEKTKMGETITQKERELNNLLAEYNNTLPKINAALTAKRDDNPNSFYTAYHTAVSAFSEKINRGQNNIAEVLKSNPTLEMKLNDLYLKVDSVLSSSNFEPKDTILRLCREIATEDNIAYKVHHLSELAGRFKNELQVKHPGLNAKLEEFIKLGNDKIIQTYTKSRESQTSNETAKNVSGSVEMQTDTNTTSYRK